LGAWLADLSDEALVRLLELRPDLTQPPPGSISALAARAQTRQSVKAVTDDLDFLRLAGSTRFCCCAPTVSWYRRPS
jgi:hypothetical protein